MWLHLLVNKLSKYPKLCFYVQNQTRIEINTKQWLYLYILEYKDQSNNGYLHSCWVHFYFWPTLLSAILWFEIVLWIKPILNWYLFQKQENNIINKGKTIICINLLPFCSLIEPTCLWQHFFQTILKNKKQTTVILT